MIIVGGNIICCMVSPNTDKGFLINVVGGKEVNTNRTRRQ